MDSILPRQLINNSKPNQRQHYKYMDGWFHWKLQIQSTHRKRRCPCSMFQCGLVRFDCRSEWWIPRVRRRRRRLNSRICMGSRGQRYMGGDLYVSRDQRVCRSGMLAWWWNYKPISAEFTRPSGSMVERFQYRRGQWFGASVGCLDERYVHITSLPYLSLLRRYQAQYSSM